MFTLWILTATWAASAPPAPQNPSPYHATISYAPVPATQARPAAVAAPVPSAPAVAGQPGVMYVEEVSPAAPQHSAYAPMPSGPVTVTAERLAMDAPHHSRDKVGHEHDYSWITGYLYYVHANGGQWVLRYADLDQPDRYGGSVVLAPTVEMQHYREGDLVRVHGEVLREGRATSALGGAFYRAQIIQMVERR